jgi:hypothetical protein
MAINPSTLYPGKIVPPTAGYPYGSAQNVTVPGDETGTPWEKVLLNDIFGFQQAMLDAAGIVPSGSADQVGASQYLESLQKIAGFPGTIVALGLNDTDPATFGVRILMLNGGSVDQDDYPELVAATYVGDGLNSAVGGAGAGFYKSSDPGGATPDTAGPWFNLPNAGGRFLRGVDDGLGIDPDGERYIGQDQMDCSISHKHGLYSNGGGYDIIDQLGDNKDMSTVASGSDGLLSLQTGPPSGVTEWIAGGRWHSEFEFGTQFYQGPAGAPSKTVEQEARPRNIAVNWGVWY